MCIRDRLQSEKGLDYVDENVSIINVLGMECTKAISNMNKKGREVSVFSRSSESLHSVECGKGCNSCCIQNTCDATSDLLTNFVTYNSDDICNDIRNNGIVRSDDITNNLLDCTIANQNGICTNQNLYDFLSYSLQDSDLEIVLGNYIQNELNSDNMRGNSQGGDNEYYNDMTLNYDYNKNTDLYDNLGFQCMETITEENISTPCTTWELAEKQKKEMAKAPLIYNINEMKHQQLSLIHI